MKPPILFLHGAFTSAERWNPWRAYFEEAGYECLAPSLPAHDPSDRSALAALTFDDYVTAVKTAAATLDRPPIVIGHSMGGLLAQHLAMDGACEALVLVSASPPWRIIGTREALPYLWRYTLPVLAGRPIRAREDVALDLVIHDLPPAEQRELLKLFGWESGRAYRTMVFGLAPVDRVSIRCPVLCVTGGADRMLRPSTSERLAKFYDAEHLIFDGHGHSLVAGSLIGKVGVAVREWIEKLNGGGIDGEPSLKPGTVV
jgi:pimeloyl-ACP methyl ester carboxylesterase